ncbi:MAG TPA: hypothetical protein VHV30_05365 [Polyangiaceae bacterium]|jgi:hypothetical protein|nr:hypothetical protein [Polyangiaceae bacterium]
MRQWSLLLSSAIGLGYGVHVPSCEHGFPGGGGADGGEAADASSDAGSESDATAPDGGAATDGGAPADAETTDAASEDAASDGGASCTVTPPSGDDASINAGFEAVWQTYRCWSCHQNASETVSSTGEGITLSGNNGGLGDAGTTFPPNLTNDPTTGIGCWTDAELQAAILHGQGPDGRVLCPAMPRWGNALTTGDGGPRPGTPMDAGTAQEIIDFIRSLPPVVNEVPRTTCAAPVTDAGSGSD